MKLEQSIKPYHTDHSIVYSCQYHVIFCPKYRRKVLVEAVALRMKELVLEKQAEYGYSVIEMEVMQDHVHLLLDVDPRGHHSGGQQNKRVQLSRIARTVSSSKKEIANFVDTQ